MPQHSATFVHCRNSKVNISYFPFGIGFKCRPNFHFELNSLDSRERLHRYSHYRAVTCLVAFSRENEKLEISDEEKYYFDCLSINNETEKTHKWNTCRRRFASSMNDLYARPAVLLSKTNMLCVWTNTLWVLFALSLSRVASYFDGS